MPRDAHHAVTRRWLEGWVNDGGHVVAPLLLLAEVGGAIARQTGRVSLGRRAVADILGDPTVDLISIDRPLAEDAARLAADLRLRGADAIYVAVAPRLAVPLLTWDREQAERARGVVATRTPAVG